MGQGSIPDLSIVVVSYNTATMTINALKSIFDTAGDLKFEILVCDNKSHDGSADRIENAFAADIGGRLKLIRSSENLGFGRANNMMAQQAQANLILLLNPDTIVMPNALQNLLEFSYRVPHAQIWGGRTLNGDGILDPNSVWGKMTLWSLFCYSLGFQKLFPRSSIFNPESYGGWCRDTECAVDVVAGCYLLISTELWRLLGGFDERFFMYAEEDDLCMRASVFGARPRFTPTSEIIHFGGASEKVYSGKMVKLLTGKMTLAQKHWPNWKLILARTILATAVVLRSKILHLLGYLGGGHRLQKLATEWQVVWQQRKVWMKGYIDGS